MRLPSIIHTTGHHNKRTAVIMILLLCAGFIVRAQELPPRPITVTVNMSQNLAFGAFTHGISGGTVIIYADGSRDFSGDVVLLSLGFTFSTALFDVVANPGTVIQIMNGPDVSLTGSYGGLLNLHIGDSYPTSPFVTTETPPDVNQVNIGGTLTIGSTLANPPGSYSGQFLITFIQE
ncbi:MAG: DUF4402 domain-containing protein [Bacteroidales bacterium]|nr:DUF4402 domain-containing protein [Bacteroidales bacterium]TFH50277.1 MAG: DUF4402 domain-containing protein [Bacteroidia bacterium]